MREAKKALAASVMSGRSSTSDRATRQLRTLRSNSGTSSTSQRVLPDLPEETIALILENLSLADMLLRGMAVSWEWRTAFLPHASQLDFSWDRPIGKLLVIASRMRWHGLQSLTLSGHAVEDEAISASFYLPLPWSCFSTVTTLILEEWEHDERVPMMLKALPNLVLLRIHADIDVNERSICDAYASEIQSLTPTRIETLEFVHGEWTVEKVAALVNVCPQLRALKLHGLDSMLMGTTPLFMEARPSLTSLSLSNMGGLTSDGLLGLVGKLPRLTHLQVIEWNEAKDVSPFDATAQALAELVLSCPSLCELDYFDFAEMFSLEDLRRIGQRLPECVMLCDEEKLAFDDGSEYVGIKADSSGRSFVELFHGDGKQRPYRFVHLMRDFVAA